MRPIDLWPLIAGHRCGRRTVDDRTYAGELMLRHLCAGAFGYAHPVQYTAASAVRAMSLSSSNRVWHAPFVLISTRVGGSGLVVFATLMMN